MKFMASPKTYIVFRQEQQPSPTFKKHYNTNFITLNTKLNIANGI